MSINILMPALSPTMTEGKLAKWHVKVGDAVKAGQVICEIETDKATMEVEAVDEGKIGQIVVPEGAEGVKVNEVIAVLLEEGETEVKSAPAPATPPPRPQPGSLPALGARSRRRPPSPGRSSSVANYRSYPQPESFLHAESKPGRTSFRLPVGCGWRLARCAFGQGP